MAAIEIVFALFFCGTVLFSALSIVSMALLSMRAADETEGFSLFVRPYSAKQMQQTSAAIETMNRLEKGTKLGRFANKSMAMMTLFGFLMYATAALDFGISKYLDQPSSIFKSDHIETGQE